MGKKKQKKTKKQAECENDLFAYGITWEEVIEEGLVGIGELN